MSKSIKDSINYDEFIKCPALPVEMTASQPANDPSSGHISNVLHSLWPSNMSGGNIAIWWLFVPTHARSCNSWKRNVTMCFRWMSNWVSMAAHLKVKWNFNFIFITDITGEIWLLSPTVSLVLPRTGSKSGFAAVVRLRQCIRCCSSMTYTYFFGWSIELCAYNNGDKLLWRRQSKSHCLVWMFTV